MIVMARRPGAHQTATASPVKSCQPWCVIVIPSRRGRHSRVSYATILDSNRAVTEILCADKKTLHQQSISRLLISYFSTGAHVHTKECSSTRHGSNQRGQERGRQSQMRPFAWGYAMLMSPNNEKTAVHGCHCWLVWLCAYVRYWLYRGAGTCAPVLKWVLNSYSSTTVDNRNELSNEVFYIR